MLVVVFGFSAEFTGQRTAATATAAAATTVATTAATATTTTTITRTSRKKLWLDDSHFPLVVGCLFGGWRTHALGSSALYFLLRLAASEINGVGFIGVFFTESIKATEPAFGATATMQHHKVLQRLGE